MRCSLLSTLVTAQCLLAFPVCAQNAAVPLSKNIDLQFKTLTLAKKDWPKSLSWQKPPDGMGELLVYPNPPRQEDIVWNKLRLLGTSVGLLCSDGDHQWRVVPSLYGKSVRIVGEYRNQLWVEQIGQGLVALKRNFKIGVRLPSVKGRCIAIDTQGFWYLDEFNDNGATALVEYSPQGREKRRFAVQDLALAPAPPPTNEKRTVDWGSGISRAEVETDAVWVHINNYHFGGFGPGDAPMRAGKEQMGRLDRITGKFTISPWPPEQRKQVSQHDKAEPVRSGMFGYRPDIWDSDSLFWASILGDDEKGIWIAAPSRTLLHAQDSGSSMAFDIGSLFWMSSSIFTPHTPPEEFLWNSYEQIAQVQSDGKVKRLSFSGNWLKKGDDIRSSLWFLGATSQRVWYYTDGGQLVTLTPDLSQPREIAQGPLFGDENSFWRHQHVAANRGSIAVGNDLYAWADSGNLLCVDGTTGETKIVESWTKRFPNDESPTPLRRAIEGRKRSAFALPDGRIAFVFSELIDRGSGPVSFTSRRLDKAHIFIYDPAKDVWLESDAIPNVRPVAAGKQLYGCDDSQLYQWRDSNWVVIGKRPLASPALVRGQGQDEPTEPKVAGTKKYFYEETALGLYRVPWSQVARK